MAKHWKIVRKYTDPETGESWTAGQEIPVPEHKGQYMLRTGLYQKVSEFEDGTPEAEPSGVRELRVPARRSQQRTVAERAGKE